MLLLLFAVGAALSVVYPQSWNSVARFVGVGRGTDMLLYCLIVAFLSFVVTSYLRFRQMEERITLLTRQLAIDEAERRAAGTADAPTDQPEDQLRRTEP